MYIHHALRIYAMNEFRQMALKKVRILFELAFFDVMFIHAFWYLPDKL